MRICWIKAGGLVPPDFGGRIRSFQMVKELARRHEVSARDIRGRPAINIQRLRLCSPASY
jgi:hypothetical protein